MKSMIAAAAAMVAMTASASAQVDDWLARADTDRLQAGEVHLGLYLNGERDGFMRLGWFLDGDTLNFYDRSMLASAELYETMRGELNAADFAPRSVEIRLHQQSTIFGFDVAFADNAVTGTFSREVPGQGVADRPIDAALPEDAIARASFFILAAIAPMDVGESYTFDWYAPMSMAVEAVTVTAVEEVEVETPAGTFQTVRLEQRGGSPANDLFVDRETGRIVRIDIGGQPMQFLALASPE